MAGGRSGDKQKGHQHPGNNNRRRRRRRREERDESNSSDDDSPEPMPSMDPRLAYLEQLQEIRQNIQELEQEYGKETANIDTNYQAQVELWNNIMQPDTDYGSDMDWVSPTDSEASTCSSNSSFLTDSSYVSSSDDADNNETDSRKSTAKKTKKKQKHSDPQRSEEYIQFQDRLNQIYTPVPDMPEEQLSEGLLCIAKCNGNWIRVLVQSYDAAAQTGKVGALDHGSYFTVERSDIKPILTELLEEHSIPYRAATTKKSSGGPEKQKIKKEKNPEERDNKSNMDQQPDTDAMMKHDTSRTTHKEHIEKEACTTEDIKAEPREDPLPSTSSSILKTDEPMEGVKKYRKSLPYLQYQWSKQQPEFLRLRDEMAIEHNFPNPETANIYAFLEFIENHESVHLDQWKVKLKKMQEKFYKKKSKIKEVYKKQFCKRLKKESEKHKNKCAILRRMHEQAIRREYLMDSTDDNFTLEEWENPAFLK